MRMTTAQALVRYLAAQHSEQDGVQQRLIPGVWAIFGHGNVGGLGQALEEWGARLDLPTYRPQNEQAMVHLAAAYAKHRRRRATFACTASIGPGSLNMLTAAAGATINRLPVLLLPSDYFANRVPDPVLQQLEDGSQHDSSVNDAFRPVSRFFSRISRPEQLLSALPQAMRVLTDPADTGCAVLSLPEDVQVEAWDWPEEFFLPNCWHLRRPPPEASQLAQAAAWIAHSERPLLLAGGGVRYSEAEAALLQLAERFGIPVCESQAGRGALPWNHPLNLGPLGANGGSAANQLARETDLLISVGCRLGDFVTASKSALQNPQLRVININVAAQDAVKLQGLPLLADAREGLRALAGALGPAWAGTSATYRAECAALKAEWDGQVQALRAPAGQTLTQSEVIGLVNAAFGGGATVVCAAGSMPGDLLKLWRPEDPLAYHVEYGFSCMGYEIPAGLGVALADPGREVVVMVGDGSYLMLNSELVTAVAEHLKLTVVVVDNHGFGSILGLQRSLGSPSFNNELRYRTAEGRLSGDPVPVDFAAHARSLGAWAASAGTREQLAAALEEARRQGGVSVVAVRVGQGRPLPSWGWWDVPVAEHSGQSEVQRARERYLQERARQRPYLPPAGEVDR